MAFTNLANFQVQDITFRRRMMQFIEKKNLPFIFQKSTFTKDLLTASFNL